VSYRRDDLIAFRDSMVRCNGRAVSTPKRAPKVAPQTLTEAPAPAPDWLKQARAEGKSTGLAAS
jgi:hypothetical protein